MPPPHQNQTRRRSTGRRTGLIVKWKRDGVTNAWQDELGRNWNDWVKFNLPDRDVFAINANANPPVATDRRQQHLRNGAGCWAGVGYHALQHGGEPGHGKIYVSNTDSQNHVRFEGPGVARRDPSSRSGEPATVQGNLAHARITVLDGANVVPRHLNKHIDYSVRARTGRREGRTASRHRWAWCDADGATLYVSGLRLRQGRRLRHRLTLENDSFTPEFRRPHRPLGWRPEWPRPWRATTPLRADALRQFHLGGQHTLTRTEIQTGRAPQPRAAERRRRASLPLRRELLTSSNGEARARAATSARHGRPRPGIWAIRTTIGSNNNNPMNDEPFVDHSASAPRVRSRASLFGNGCTFHPMKGPMTTQSLRGLELQGPQHWRGDRVRATRQFAFLAFNGAFPGLVGREYSR